MRPLRALFYLWVIKMSKEKFSEEEDRAIINLICNYDYRYRDVAEVLGRSVGSICSRVYQLRRQGFSIPTKRRKEPSSFAPLFPVPSLIPKEEQFDQMELQFDRPLVTERIRKRVLVAATIIATGVASFMVSMAA